MKSCFARIQEWIYFHQNGCFDFIRTLLGFNRARHDFISLFSLKTMLYGFYEVIKVAENKLADLSTELAIKILKLTDSVKGHYSLMNQLERSGTSIGANIREAKYAHSKPDFISKLQISLKECYETEYWLELLEKSQLVPIEVVKPLSHDCGVIRKMLISSINTAKDNNK